MSAQEESQEVVQAEEVQAEEVVQDIPESEEVVEEEAAAVEEEEEEEEEEEDLVDPMDEVKEKCSASHHCEGYKKEWDSCTERVSSRSNTEETCVQEFFDFLHCVDHCVSEKLFAHLK